MAKSQRQLLLAPATVAALRAHLNRQRQERLALGPAWTDSGYVFVDEVGVEYHPHRFTKMFEDAVKRVDVPKIRLFAGDRWFAANVRSGRAGGSSHLHEERIMLKPAAVLTIVLVLGAGGAASAAPPEDGFSCEYTNKAEVTAKDGSSGAPSGGTERGEEAASKQGNAQFNFCDAYGSN